MQPDIDRTAQSIALLNDQARTTLTNCKLMVTRGIDLLGEEAVDGETIEELRAEDLPTRDLERVVKHRKQLAVQRNLRIAEKYIKNVVLGEFPKRDG